MKTMQAKMNVQAELLHLHNVIQEMKTEMYQKATFSKLHQLTISLQKKEEQIENLTARIKVLEGIVEVLASPDIQSSQAGYQQLINGQAEQNNVQANAHCNNRSQTYMIDKERSRNVVRQGYSGNSNSFKNQTSKSYSSPRKNLEKTIQGKKEVKETPIQTVRIVMFGLGGVGKTSLIHRFLFQKFDSTYTATIEDDYRQVITYNNHIVDVTVLDTAGSYQFPAMRKHAIQNCQGFILVYAIDHKPSLDEVNRIYLEISSVKGEGGGSAIIVVGNKCDKDVSGKRKVDPESVQDLIRGWNQNVEHMETSAKTDVNVTDLFNKMISIIDDMRVEKEGKSSIHFRTTYEQQQILDQDVGSFQEEPGYSDSSVLLPTLKSQRTGLSQSQQSIPNIKDKHSPHTTRRHSDIRNVYMQDAQRSLSLKERGSGKHHTELQRSVSSKAGSSNMNKSQSCLTIHEEEVEVGMRKKQRFIDKMFTKRSKEHQGKCM